MYLVKRFKMLYKSSKNCNKHCKLICAQTTVYFGGPLLNYNYRSS